MVIKFSTFYKYLCYNQISSIYYCVEQKIEQTGFLIFEKGSKIMILGVFFLSENLLTIRQKIEKKDFLQNDFF